MKVCPSCAAEVDDEAFSCQHCGRNIAVGRGLRASGEKLRTIGWGLALLITIPIIVLLLMTRVC